MVTVVATDSGNITASIDVTITVTDVNEPPAITGDAEHDYAENGAGDVATFTATDPDAGAAITWEMSGADASLFDISGGVLTFVSPPDYENPADADTDNVYMVTVEADDGTNSNTLDVTVTVTDVDDAISGDTLLERYDADKSGAIEKPEVIVAINDYLFGVGDAAITKDEVIKVINLYLFG